MRTPRIALCVTAALVASTLATSSVSAAAGDVPFACDPGFYQVVSGQLAELDPAAGRYTTLGDDQPNYNALGYRQADGLMYAIRGDVVLKVDAVGVVTELGTVAITPGAYTGDFGDDGLLHVSRGGQDWYEVDVDTLQATRRSDLSQNRSVADVVNVYGRFLGVSRTGELWIFDPGQGVVSSGGLVAGLPASPAAYGAAWSTAGGNLYVGRNSGEIFQITGWSTGSPSATQVATAPPTSSNDGASCSLAAPPAGIADVDGLEPEVQPSTPEGQAAAEAWSAEGGSSTPTYEISDAGIGTGATCEATVDEDRAPRVAIDPLAVTEPTTLYAEGFEQAAPGMQVLSGSWIVESGAYRQLNTCGYDYTALLTTTIVENYTFAVAFHAVEGSNQGGIVINQSSPDTRSGAMLIDLADDGATLRWGHYDESGYYRNIGWDLVPSAGPGESVRLSVDVRGTSVTIHHNGNTVVTAEAPNAEGMVGLVTSLSTVAFTEATLTAVPA